MNAGRLCTAVDVRSPLYGDCGAVLRDINERMCLVEMNYAPPLGTELVVCFGGGRTMLQARAIVLSTFYSGPGLDAYRLVEMRFVGFVADEFATPAS